jgi:hypothetical protein
MTQCGEATKGKIYLARGAKGGKERRHKLFLHSYFSFFLYCWDGGGSDWEVLGQCDIVRDYGLHTINELNEKKKKREKKARPLLPLAPYVDSTKSEQSGTVLCPFIPPKTQTCLSRGSGGIKMARKGPSDWPWSHIAATSIRRRVTFKTGRTIPAGQGLSFEYVIGWMASKFSIKVHIPWKIANSSSFGGTQPGH